MNNTQNKKIAQVSDGTLVIGVDVGVTIHSLKKHAQA